MIRKRLILFGFVSVLAFSTLPGCGCGAVQTSVPSETVSVEESTSSPETVIHEETPSATETEAVETESETADDVTVTEETASPEEIGIIEMDAIMYATTSVNERKEPSADSEKIGSLSTGEEVHVTGQTKDEQWYRIEISGIDEGFVASQYLSNDKPIIEQPESQAPAETTPAPETLATEAPVETPSTSTGGSTTTAPNPGAQEVYDRVQSGQSSGDTNASRFANAVDGTGLISSNPGTGVLHAE